MASVDIEAIVPHFQRRPGLLTAALRSAFAQDIAQRLCIVICDDSPQCPKVVRWRSHSPTAPIDVM